MLFADRFYNPDPETDGDGREKPANSPWTFRRQMQQAKAQLPPSKGVWLTEEGQGPDLQATRMLAMELSYNSNARTQGWTQGEVLQSLDHARMWVTAIAEGGTGYSYHTLQGLRVDDANTPLLALCNVHTLARLGLGRRSTNASRLELGQNSSSAWIGYRFDVAPDGDGCSLVVAVWPRDARFATAMPVTVASQDPSQLSIISQWGNTVPLEASSSGATFQLDRAVNFICLRGDASRGGSEAAGAIAAALAAVPGGPRPSVAWPDVPKG